MPVKRITVKYILIVGSFRNYIIDKNSKKIDICVSIKLYQCGHAEQKSGAVRPLKTIDPINRQ